MAAICECGHAASAHPEGDRCDYAGHSCTCTGYRRVKPKPANEGKRAKILAAIVNGCETVSDIECELDFTMRRDLISAHVSNLKQDGAIVCVGFVTEQHEGPRRGKTQTMGFRAGRYQVVTRETCEPGAAETQAATFAHGGRPLFPARRPVAQESRGDERREALAKRGSKHG